MFKIISQRIITEVKCSKCNKEFEYDKQDKCPHCGVSEDYVDTSDIPF